MGHNLRKKRTLGTKKRIVWAVNPFEKDPHLCSAPLLALEELISKKAHNTEVLPVYVGKKILKSQIKDIRAQCREIVERSGAIFRKDSHHPADLRVLVESGSSLKKKAEHLLKFADKSKADLIVLSTHARSGFESWWLGSFAETLSMISSIPLLIINPKWHPEDSQYDFAKKSILFPTDFSKESIASFRKVIALAKETNRSITLFHHVDFFFYPVDEPSLVLWQTISQNQKVLAKTSAVHARRLVSFARKKGVTVHTVIDTTKKGAASDAILEHLLQMPNYSLVALASHSGLLSRVFLGSTTRELIRHSPLPVWIIHPGSRTYRGAVRPLKDVSELPKKGKFIQTPGYQGYI